MTHFAFVFCAARFAHWLEDSPEDAFRPEQLRKLPVVQVGELPELSGL